jgi:hypothetical protein
MEAVVFLFILDKFNNSLPSTPFQLLIIILSCNSQIVFLSYKDQHPKSRGRERERKRREGAAGG